MVKYIGEKNYEHGSKEKIGVLITNLGTPDAPNKKNFPKTLIKPNKIYKFFTRIKVN